MADALPPRPNLDWLRKTAKQQLLQLRSTDPAAQLASAQLALARQYGFPSWRRLKTHIEQLPASAPDISDAQAAAFLRAVGNGEIATVRALLAATPALVNCIGPHPFWGGRPQPQHVAIETSRYDIFELLLAAGADVNGSNEQYDQWSPLMLAHDKPQFHQALLARGARVRLAEALLMADDELTAQLLQPGKRALPKVGPNAGSILAFARTTFAIDRLLELGVPREQRDRWGASPIEAMSRLGPRGAHLVAHLLQRGIPAQPQEYARMGDQQRLVELIAAQPQLARDDEVLMGAVDFGHHELVSWLLQQGANVNARASNPSHCSALHSAAWNGDLRMVQLLVGAGASLATLDDEHQGTAREWAEVSIRVTNNPRCEEVAAYLRACEGEAVGRPSTHSG